MASTKTYLYLAHRDKRGIKILGLLASKANILPVKVTDINQVGLPHNVLNEYNNLITENKMLYEPWIESAENYQVLKESLQNRGFKNLPVSEQPITRSLMNIPISNTGELKQQQIMMQKRKQ